MYGYCYCYLSILWSRLLCVKLEVKYSRTFDAFFLFVFLKASHYVLLLWPYLYQPTFFMSFYFILLLRHALYLSLSLLIVHLSSFLKCAGIFIWFLFIFIRLFAFFLQFRLVFFTQFYLTGNLYRCSHKVVVNMWKRRFIFVYSQDFENESKRKNECDTKSVHGICDHNVTPPATIRDVIFSHSKCFALSKCPGYFTSFTTHQLFAIHKNSAGSSVFLFIIIIFSFYIPSHFYISYLHLHNNLHFQLTENTNREWRIGIKKQNKKTTKIFRF